MDGAYIGEIRMFGFAFNPRKWALCDGRSMSIKDNVKLFDLLKTQFGGDGKTTFNLPDLRGRVPVHTGLDGMGLNYVQGESGGLEKARLSIEQLPAHTHPLNVTEEDGTSAKAEATNDSVFAKNIADKPGLLYGADGANLTQLNAEAVTTMGGGDAHSNAQPSQVVNFCISLDGIYPTGE